MVQGAITAPVIVSFGGKARLNLSTIASALSPRRALTIYGSSYLGGCFARVCGNKQPNGSPLDARFASGLHDDCCVVSFDAKAALCVVPCAFIEMTRDENAPPLPSTQDWRSAPRDECCGLRFARLTRTVGHIDVGAIM